jgi:hypothetical protein
MATESTPTVHVAKVCVPTSQCDENSEQDAKRAPLAQRDTGPILAGQRRRHGIRQVQTG